MSETDLAVIKPEMMKPYVWLQTSDDSIQQVEQEIAMFCPLICQEIIQKGMGSSKNCAICLPQQVSPSMLSLILDYCRFHQVPGRSNKERKSYDEKFVRIDTERLCELTSAADSLQLKPLVDLTSRALARIIEGKTPEEIRDIFHLPDDLTEEEKLEPLRNITADPRIRLLNRLYAKKRKELRERERLKNVEVEEEHVDDRSVDDLLSFINGKDGDPKGVKTSKNKKKNRRKKEQQKNSSLKEASELNKKEANGHDIRHQSSEAERISETSHLHDAEDDAFTSKPEFDDGDMDDEIDPALKEKIDREVEDFARRLNSDWPERMQELLSSGQERKTMLFTSGSCYKDEDATCNQPIKSEETDSTNPTNVCIKCKLNDAVSGYGGIDDGRFCADCFKTNLFGKFRFAVTSNAMITPTDKVLVAFSGGPSSRVALQFVHDMQERAQRNFDASRDRSLPVFGVGVVFIDEGAVLSIPSSEMEEVVEVVREVVSGLVPPRKELHVVPIETVYSSDSGDGKERLIKVMNTVSDPTGREDMLICLRMLALQKVASECGYNRIVLGSCISRIACHVISATVKGQGYSLPADIQYVDARWEVPVVLPLRDCFAQEINMLCHLDGLKTVKLSTGPCSSINGLVSSFVSLLQEENPSRESTIVRTAGKLTPFQFNRIPEIIDGNVPLATRRRQKRYNLKSNESVSSESFCPLCNSPLNKSEIVDWSNMDIHQNSDNFYNTCCSSCQFQILPSDSTSMEQFYMDLPQSMVGRAKQASNGDLSLLREQIQDFLLSDGEDEK